MSTAPQYQDTRLVEFKIGTHEIPVNFSLQQFIAQYCQQNQKKYFDPNALAEDVLYQKEGRTVADTKTPPVAQAMFLEGPITTKVRKVFSSTYQVPEPLRCFLLFKDEYWKELPAPNDERSQKAGGLWVFQHWSDSKSILAAGKLYSTGKRIIIDATYTESNIEFATMQLFGKIDFQSFAQACNLPYLTLKKFVKYKGGKPKYEPFNAIGLETEIDRVSWQEAIGFLGGAVKIGIPGTERFHTNVNSVLKGPDGSKIPQNSQQIYALSEALNQEIESLKPVNLEDILAMWQYASAYGFLEASQTIISGKKSVSLVI